MKNKIIVGNWKMNLNVDQSLTLVEEIGDSLHRVNASTQLVIAPNYVSLSPVLDLIRRRDWSQIEVSAQDVHEEEDGAFTGKISTSMLNAIGVKYSLVGHSEQRILFQATNQSIHLKVVKLIETQMVPILCVGETLQQKENGRLEQVLEEQLSVALKGLPDFLEKNEVGVIIAYEPVWAIGTGRTASSEQADAAHKVIRSILDKVVGHSGKRFPVLYGGSVKPANAQDLLSMPHIDGLLVGGASLKSSDFLSILEA